MTITPRPEFQGSLQNIVVKIGSAALADQATGQFDPGRVQVMAQDLADLVSQGYRPVLVSSGAILAGRKNPRLQTLLAASPHRDVATLQAASALGQPLLMNAYLDAFAKAGVAAAQVLLTHDDLMNHQRSLNLKNMLHVLIELGVVPVINENDSVSFEEITVGDNDQLAAMVAVLLEVEALVMITTPDGLYSQDPLAGVGQAPQGISHVAYGDPLVQVSLAGKSAAGRGGMSTKLEAVRKVTPFGIPVVLATSRALKPIVRALTTPCGTFFSPYALDPLNRGESANQRKKKLTTMAKLNAEVVVDQGAALALKGHKSLLPSGIVKVVGQFRRGDSVKIVYQKSILAVGLAEYSAQDLRAIKGKQSDEIEGILGFCTAKVAFHRNNLYWLQEPGGQGI